MRFFYFLLIFSVTAYVRANEEPDYCFNTDTERVALRHFGCITSYEQPKDDIDMERHFRIPGCEPAKFWIVVRHGTRMPVKSIQSKDLPQLYGLRDRILKNYAENFTRPTAGVGALCPEDLEGLRRWKLNDSITLDDTDNLTEQGFVEQRGIAEWFQKFYPKLLPRNFDAKRFMFQHSYGNRTFQSMDGFMQGLFGFNHGATSVPVEEGDYKLEIVNNCPTWAAHPYKAPDSEDVKFRQSQFWNDTLRNISLRLGFEDSLKPEDIKLMWDVCRYEASWKMEQDSYWCAAFPLKYSRVFEYRHDLNYYYKFGYGYEPNYRFNCHLVQDMLQRLDHQGSPDVIAYFSHSSAIQLMLAPLGIRRDKHPPLATNYPDMANRNYSSSIIDPFSSNIGVVKYDCEAGNGDKSRAIFFLNQNIIRFDWCNDGICNWSDVLKKYHGLFVANCDDIFCPKSPSSSSKAQASIIVMLSAVFCWLTQNRF